MRLRLKAKNHFQSEISVEIITVSRAGYSVLDRIWYPTVSSLAHRVPHKSRYPIANSDTLHFCVNQAGACDTTSFNSFLRSSGLSCLSNPKLLTKSSSPYSFSSFLNKGWLLVKVLVAEDRSSWMYLLTQSEKRIMHY